MVFEVVTLKERPDLRPRIFAAAFWPPLFPEFTVHPAGVFFPRRLSVLISNLRLRRPISASQPAYA
jgi:hypothetical protein